MAKTLKDIIKNSSDLYSIKVLKPNKYDRQSWKFIMDDPRWKDESFKNYKFKTVQLRRENGFFLAYRCDESNAYFVDPKRAMYRNTIEKYVSNLVDYSVKSNDISKTKNEPSVRVTQIELKQKGIDNFIDLCYEYKDFTAIGTGYTRDIRNLIVMDIDVDCTKPDNKEELDNILLLFAKYNTLPNFYIFNNQSKHIQLQWVIQNLQYKDIDDEIISNIISELKYDPNKNKEINYRNIDFTQISDIGILYRRYTMALCSISKKRKFGDKNYTFWKAKNPMSALTGIYDLELKMPYLSNGEIKYMSNEDMQNIFSSKNNREKYFNNSPTFQEWYDKLSELMIPLVEKVTEKKVMKIDDAYDVSEIKSIDFKKQTKHNTEGFGESRNTFVINCTKFTTLEFFNKSGYRSRSDINKMTHEQFTILKKEIYNLVYKRFKKKDKEYNFIWPDTTNISSFTKNDFDKAFNSAFQYAINNINNFSYSNDDRKKSQMSRCFNKELKIIIVDKIRQENKNISRGKLLNDVNLALRNLYIKPISEGSLKRYISNSNDLTDGERQRLNSNLNTRLQHINSRKT